jgi:hypothetical protein
MQAASLLDGLSFDGFPPFKYSRSSAKVDVSRRQVVQALVVSTVVVVLDELVDAMFELTWQIVVFQQDLVFHRAVISLDPTLRHRVVRPAADMADAVILEPVAKLARDVGWTIIAQQPFREVDGELRSVGGWGGRPSLGLTFYFYLVICIGAVTGVTQKWITTDLAQPKWELEFGRHVAVGWQVAVNFETDADFNQNRCRPDHGVLPLDLGKLIEPWSKDRSNNQ